MINKNRIYYLNELINKFNFYDLEFENYNNGNSRLKLYLKTGTDKVSVFKSLKLINKERYNNLTSEKINEYQFKFYEEVEEIKLDIVVIVLKSSNIKIPCSKYTIKKLDNLLKKVNSKKEDNKENLNDGIAYLIVDNNSACPLYDNIYLFENNKSFIEELKINYKNEENDLIKSNLKLILDYYKETELNAKGD